MTLTRIQGQGRSYGGEVRKLRKRQLISKSISSIDMHACNQKPNGKLWYPTHNTCIPPIFQYGSECWAVTKRDVLKIDALGQWCLRKLLGIMCGTARWNAETDNRATTPFSHCQSTRRFSLFDHRRNRCQEDLNCLPFGELEETTRTPSYYVYEDNPTRPEIQQPLPERSNRCGSKSSTSETDVYVRRYALLMVHATKKKNDNILILTVKFFDILPGSASRDLQT